MAGRSRARGCLGPLGLRSSLSSPLDTTVLFPDAREVVGDGLVGGTGDYEPEEV